MKNLVCVFAHPDDEAFGPGGTIAKFAKNHNVYILCATKGEQGNQNQKSPIRQAQGKKQKLGDIRAGELRKSAKILGVKKVYFLGFKDGTLSNNLYHKLASKIKKKLIELKPSIVLTFEPMGGSGHIDHITVSMTTMFAIRKVKFVKEVWQVCRPESFLRKRQDYFIYFPPGYKKSEIDKIIDTSKFWQAKVAAMRVHKSQISDVERILKIQQRLPKEEYFLVKKI